MAQEAGRRHPRRVKTPRVTRRALEPFWLTRPEAEAKRLRRRRKTTREIAAAILARFDGVKGARLTRREKHQMDSLREMDDARVHRTIREWLAKGNVRRGKPKPPPSGVPVWVDRVRCATCGRPEAVLRKVLTRRDVHGRGAEAWAARVLPLLPSGEEGVGYCRTCKRYRRVRVVESRRVPDAEVRPLVTAWAGQPRLRRSRFLLQWLEEARGGGERDGSGRRKAPAHPLKPLERRGD